MARRAKLDEAARAPLDEAITRHLVRFLEQGAYAQVFAYAAFRGEANLAALPRLLPKLCFALPVVADEPGLMHFYEWHREALLRSNRWGIAEPNPHESRRLEPDGETLILAPCVAVDGRGYRLGYGGGYYDRYLAQERHAKLAVIGVTYANLRVAALPIEAHDRPMAGLVTEHGLTSF